jgi:c-di-GMP-related signal transduction protein
MAVFMVGRQPIFDKSRKVYGYELLFREPGGLLADGDAMTADVLVRAGLDMGLSNLVGDKLAFVNATRPFLVGEQDLMLPPKQTVVEVPETVAHDREALAGCRRLVSDGYTVALDNCNWSWPNGPLVELISLVKLDVLAFSPARLVSEVPLFRSLGVELLAEKVETVEQFELCQELGFSLFQGYLLSRPEVVEGQSLSPGKLACLRLVNELYDPEADADYVRRVIEADAALAYRFLRLAGEGAARGLYRPVRSLKEAIVVLGLQKLRAWAMLMLLSGRGGTNSEQLHIAMTRARMAELLAAESDPELADSAFLVGLVSSLDLLLGLPLSEVLSRLALAEEVVAAVLEGDGFLGSVLDDVLAWERGGEGLKLHLSLHFSTMEKAYLSALAWANEVCSLAAT